MSALEKAWQCGKRLNEMKRIIGHGNWLTYLQSQLPEISESTAQRYMKIDRDNPNAARVKDLKFDSIRKHCLSLAPAKKRPQLKGDLRDWPCAHYLSAVNFFARWYHRVKIGLAQSPPREVLRHDLEPTLRRMIELCGKEWALEKLFEQNCRR